MAKTTSFPLLAASSGSGHRRIGEDEQRQLPAFLAGAQLREAYQRRLLRQALAEGDDVGMTRGGLVIAGLGDGARRLRTCRGRDAEEAEQGDEQ